MWGGSALARKWGATQTVGLNDGMGQGNNIAVFPTKVRGGAAQFDLWHSSGNYRNKTLRAAITKWSGGNWVDSYCKFLRDRVPGLRDDTVISDQFMASASGVAFCKAQAWHEAGKPYPMSDAEWQEAQKLVHGDKAVKLPKVTTPAAAPVIVAPVVAASGLPPLAVVGIVVVVAIIAFAAYTIFKREKQRHLEAQIQAAEAR